MWMTVMRHQTIFYHHVEVSELTVYRVQPNLHIKTQSFNFHIFDQNKEKQEYHNLITSYNSLDFDQSATYPGPRCLTERPRHSSYRPTQSLPRISLPALPCHQSDDARTKYQPPQTCSCTLWKIT